MKKISIYGFILALASFAVFTSCKDDFTEEDSLKEQQTIDLSVYAFDPNTSMGVANATVFIVKDGKQDSVKTNADGIAVFPDIKISSGVPITVQAEGYATAKTTSYLVPEDYRQSQITQRLDLYSTTGANTATIRGKVDIETDLTNKTTEKAPAGTLVSAFYNTGEYSQISVTTTVDANGNYSLNVPATKSGITIQLRFPDLELDQKIATWGLEGDAGFPSVLPSIQNVKTVFNTSGDAKSIPSVAPVVATIGAEPTGTGAQKATLIASSTSGKINSISVFDGGKGYAASSTTIPVTITSLLGGTGATATATTDADGMITSVAVTAQGADYPATGSSANYKSTEDPSFPTSVSSVKPGDIRVLDVDYGTGNSRDKDIR